MSGYTDIKHEETKERSFDFTSRKRKRKNGVVLTITIILVAVIGYLLILNMDEFYRFL